jgi:2-succinyl-5-enolpyruvyl-6-hydroxy-3-cyclohexene-1-carboxylate synthase
LAGFANSLTFSRLAEAFGLDYVKPEDTKSFIDAYQQAQKSDRSCIIEVVTDREVNRAAHVTLQNRIRVTLSRENK